MTKRSVSLHIYFVNMYVHTYTHTHTYTRAQYLYINF